MLRSALSQTSLTSSKPSDAVCQVRGCQASCSAVMMPGLKLLSYLTPPVFPIDMIESVDDWK